MNNDNAITQARNELAVASQAARAKALVEAKFTIAMHRPRSWSAAREGILEQCQRLQFAETAWYAKPIGKDKVRGPSIRFVETALQCLRNVDVSTTTLYEDDERRVVAVQVVDLETNITYSSEVNVEKHVERRYLKQGVEVIRERENTRGEKVYIVKATEDELAIKTAALISKQIRNNGLRLIPGDLIEEAEKTVKRTLHNQDGDDPKARVKKVLDALKGIGVSAKAVEDYLGRPVETMTPDEVQDLREIYQGIKNEGAKWKDFVAAKNDDPEEVADKPGPQAPKKKATAKKPAGSDEKPEQAQATLIDEEPPKKSDEAIARVKALMEKKGWEEEEAISLAVEDNICSRTDIGLKDLSVSQLKQLEKSLEL